MAVDAGSSAKAGCNAAGAAMSASATRMVPIFVCMCGIGRGRGRDLVLRPGCSRLLGESEDPEGSACRHGSEPRVTREERVDAADADRHRNVLHAVLLPGHRLTFDPRAGLELPQLLAGI